MEGNGIGLQLAGSRINRRDPSRIYNAVFASSNRSGLFDNYCSATSFLSPSTATSDSSAAAIAPPGKLETKKNPNGTHILRARYSYVVSGYRVPPKQHDRGAKIQLPLYT